MSTQLSPQMLPIALVGKEATGKSSLAAHLQEKTYFSPRHGSQFRFTVVDKEQLTAEMWIIVFDATIGQSFARDLVKEAKEHEVPFCVAGTKHDALAQSCPSVDLMDREYACVSRYHHGAEYVPVSSVTGEGIQDLMQHIVNVVYPLPPPRKSLVHVFESGASALLSSLLDLIAVCCKLPQPRPKKDTTAPPSFRDDDEFFGLLFDKPQEADKEWAQNLLRRLGARPSQSPGVHFIAPSFVTKDPSPSEKATMEFVRKHTNIPIPRTHCDNLKWLVVDHIEGRMVYECWNDLGIWMQFRVACTLRLYVKQLRSLTSDRVGGLVHGELHGPVFNFSEYGPFRSVDNFRHFCDWVALMDWKRVNDYKVDNGLPVPPLPSSTGKWDLVFTHGDLNTSNMILDDDGMLWVLDWGAAGFYPPSVEWQSMQQVDGDGDNMALSRMPKSWARYRWFITGRRCHDSERHFWKHFVSGIHYYPQLAAVAVNSS